MNNGGESLHVNSHIAGSIDGPSDAMNLGTRYRSPEEPQSWLQRHKGVARSFATAFLVAVIMHLPQLKMAVVWTCSIVVAITGKPERLVKIEEAMDRMGQRVAKAEHDAPAKFASIMTPLKEGGLVEKITETAVAPAKAVVTNVVEKVETAKEKGVEVVKDTRDAAVKTGDKVVQAVQSMGNQQALPPIPPGQKPPAQNAGFGSGLGRMIWGDPAAKEKAARDQLEYRAAKLHLKVDKDWSTPELQARVEEAQMRWNVNHGPNALCPGCKNPMRVSTKLGTGQTVGCSICPATFPARRARDLYQAKIMALQLKR